MDEQEEAEIIVSQDILRLRADLLCETRRFLSDRGYLEVQTPILLPGVCVEAHLEPFVTSLVSASSKSEERKLYLQTSPELGMKCLLAAGAGSIYQITRGFRNAEVGPLHNPEFTIVEWYRVGGSYHDLMSEVGEVVGQILNRQTRSDACPGKLEVGTCGADRITYLDAFLQYAGLDPHITSEEELERLACEHGFNDDSASRDDLLDFLLTQLVEPHLGVERPTFLFDYPATQSALSRVRPDDPPVAERFELFVNGIELCNGYQELTDAEELLRRTERENQIRLSKGKSALPIDPRLIVAMRSGLPECAGVALGFDRVVMVAAGSTSLSEVVAFPLDRA